MSILNDCEILANSLLFHKDKVCSKIRNDLDGKWFRIKKYSDKKMIDRIGRFKYMTIHSYMKEPLVIGISVLRHKSTMDNPMFLDNVLYLSSSSLELIED